MTPIVGRKTGSRLILALLIRIGPSAMIRRWRLKSDSSRNHEKNKEENHYCYRSNQGHQTTIKQLTSPQWIPFESRVKVLGFWSAIISSELLSRLSFDTEPWTKWWRKTSWRNLESTKKGSAMSIGITRTNAQFVGAKNVNWVPAITI